MATRTASFVPYAVDARRKGSGQTLGIVYSGLLQGDVGSAVVLNSDPLSMTVQAKGTAGGATIAVQGSWDGGTTWTALRDVWGATIALGTGSAAPLALAPPSLRVSVTGGDGTTNMTVTFALRSADEVSP